MARFEIGTASPANAPTPRATVTAGIEEFDPILERLDGLANRLGVLNVRINGQRPQADGEGKPDAPPPPTTITALQARRRRLSFLVETIGRELQEVEDGIGC
jgi:hypothetical protein